MHAEKLQSHKVLEQFHKARTFWEEVQKKFDERATEQRLKSQRLSQPWRLPIVETSNFLADEVMFAMAVATALIASPAAEDAAPVWERWRRLLPESVLLIVGAVTVLRKSSKTAEPNTRSN